MCICNDYARAWMLFKVIYQARVYYRLTCCIRYQAKWLSHAFLDVRFGIERFVTIQQSCLVEQLNTADYKD